ncbi:MAG: NAD+ synthase [Acidimicrobiia bacterium]|nr:NAD+ synthase [Acidimicrobiia bacterium]
MRVAGAQLNLTVGDLAGNRDLLLDAMARAQEGGADILLTPELAVTGYPPEDLVHRAGFVERNLEVLHELAAAAGPMTTLVGFVDVADGPSRRHADANDRGISNSGAFIRDGAVVAKYHKVLLPNYGVFDEARYFVPGSPEGQTFDIGGVAVGLTICEDIWVAEGPPAAHCAAGAEVLLNINGSPFHMGKGVARAELLSQQATRFAVPIVYLNLIGGQDELVFDGQSMAFDAEGTMIFRASQFSEELFFVDLAVGGGADQEPVVAEDPIEEQSVYRALTVGLRDYVHKNGFEGVVVGLSGGIDSALTAVIAADALGPEAVWGVAMPGPYNAPESESDAADLAHRLGIRLDVIGIGKTFDAHREALAEVFADTPEGVAEENLQARIRGATLMAISNKYGQMVVATGNKSEMSVGYATLYGDMVGGFAVLKDVSKTLVYRLANWRNRESEVIPVSIIDKAPSAELRPNQVDSDTLPPYDTLDRILELYVEDDLQADQIVAAGFDETTVGEVISMVDRNEYKRRQAAPGVRITEKAFGRDRRQPITHRYRG